MRADQLTKHYEGVDALSGVDMTIRSGDIHALVGANGAGKSTLVRCLSGVESPDSGSLVLDGVPVSFHSPQDGLDAGIAVVHQELSLFGPLTVAENLLGPWRRRGIGINWKQAWVDARQLLDSVGLQIDSRMRVDQLSVGGQQMLEIVRALNSGARVILLDEPTSALSPAEGDALFEFVHARATRGVAFVLVTHFIDDVFAHADTVTVLRDGHLISSRPVAGVSRQTLVDELVGTETGALHDTIERGQVELPHQSDSPVVLEVRHISRPPSVSGVSLEVHKGEVLGLYGDLASGHIEFAETLFGLERAKQGDIHVDGHPLRMSSTKAAKDAGLAYIPADRRKGLALQQPLYRNVTLANLHRIQGQFLDTNRELDLSQDLIRRLRIAGATPERHVGALSGGNQQKVLLARWLVGDAPKVLILVEPTRGMDVGAKGEVLEIVQNLAEGGTAILIISSEPELVLSAAQRIVVMRRGLVVREFVDQKVTRKMLLEASL